jgi:hypothetical protein
MSDGLPISRSATSAAKRLRCWIARVNPSDAEPWEVIAERGRRGEVYGVARTRAPETIGYLVDSEPWRRAAV